MISPYLILTVPGYDWTQLFACHPQMQTEVLGRKEVTQTNNLVVLG